MPSFSIRVVRCLLLLGLTLPLGCECEVGPGVPDVQIQRPDVEVAADAGVADAQGEVGDVVIPISDEETATTFCIALRRGLANQEARDAQSTLSCNDDTPLVDLGEGDIELAPGSCTPADELYRVILESLQSGRARVDLDALAQCQEAGRATRREFNTFANEEAAKSALESLTEDAQCQSALVAHVELEGACEHDFECAQGRCQSDPLDAPRRCLEPAAEGAACSETESVDRLPLRVCEQGTACVLEFCTRRLTEGLECTADGVPCLEELACSPAGLCAPRAQEGSLCDVSDQCAAGLVCSREGLCESALRPRGAVCVTSSQCEESCDICKGGGLERVCAPRGVLSDVCVNNADCASEFYCLAGLCAADLPLDAACTPGSCESGAGCSAAMPEGQEPLAAAICRLRPGAGEACGFSNELPCTFPYACTGGQCYAGELDDPCTNDIFCREGRYCEEGSCKPLPRAGAPCGERNRCEVGTRCVSERCRDFPSAGEACFEDGACAEDAFCNESLLCAAKKEPSEACVSDEECLSGDCLGSLRCANVGAHCLSTRGALFPLIGLGTFLLVIALPRRKRR